MPSVGYSTMKPTEIEQSGPEDEEPGLAISLVAIIIPSVILAMLCFVLIGYYVWKCYNQYLENEENAKQAERQNKQVPFAEPEADFSPTGAADILDVEVSTS